MPMEPPREDLRADFVAIVKHVDAFEEDEAQGVLDRITTKVASDRELALATYLALAEGFRGIYDSGWAAKMLQAALAVAPPGRWIELAMEHIAALEGDHEHEQAEAMAAELFARVPAADAFDVRMRLASAYAKECASKAATRLLRAALAEAREDAQRISVLVELRASLRSDEADSAEIAALDALLAQPHALSVDAQIRGHLELATWRYWERPAALDVVLRHAALAAELGTRSADVELRDRAPVTTARRCLTPETSSVQRRSPSRSRRSATSTGARCSTKVRCSSTSAGSAARSRIRPSPCLQSCHLATMTVRSSSSSKSARSPKGSRSSSRLPRAWPRWPTSSASTRCASGVTARSTRPRISRARRSSDRSSCMRAK